jgi:hypothetical protein
MRASLDRSNTVSMRTSRSRVKNWAWEVGCDDGVLSDARSKLVPARTEMHAFDPATPIASSMTETHILTGADQAGTGRWSSSPIAAADLHFTCGAAISGRYRPRVQNQKGLDRRRYITPVPSQPLRRSAAARHCANSAASACNSPVRPRRGREPFERFMLPRITSSDSHSVPASTPRVGQFVLRCAGLQKERRYHLRDARRPRGLDIERRARRR